VLWLPSIMFSFNPSNTLRTVSHILDGTQTLSAKAAAALDKELMSTGAFSIDQLMELAGLSVSQAGWCPKSTTIADLLVCCGLTSSCSLPGPSPEQGPQDPGGCRSRQQW
jgi:hypothetical protein